MSLIDAAPAPAAAGGLVPHVPFQFRPAINKAFPVRIAIDGPSGSGRTLGALRLGAALGNSLAVIDTERGRAARYADEIPFAHLIVHHFDPEDLFAQLASAAAYGHDVLIVDTHTPYWNGPGGLLERVNRDAHSGYGGNKAGWDKNRPMERRVTEALLAYPGYVLVILRSNVETFLEPDAAGRQVVRRKALKPQQRDGLEYDYDLVGSFGPVGVLNIVKSAIPELVDKVIEDPGEQLAQVIRRWVSAQGEPAPSATDFLQRIPEATFEELRILRDEAVEAQVGGAAVLDPSGTPLTLSELIVARATALKAQLRATV